MTWTPIPNHPNREYENNPADPGGAQSKLWAKQSAGIRKYRNHEVYVETRIIGETASSGEISKTYWDNH